MAKVNVFKAEMAHDLGEDYQKVIYGLVKHVRKQAMVNGPYGGSNTAYIADDSLEGAIAASYCGVKHFDGHIDYTLAGNADGLTRAGSNPWTLEHKEVRQAGKANPPAGWNTVQKTAYFWTVPFAAEKVDRPSQSKRLNKSGESASPFKGGIDLLADLFMSVLDEPTKANFKAKLKARTEYNLANGAVGWGGPTGEYCEKCAETREARGVTMARTTGTRGIGIYAKMTQEQDEELSALINKSHYEDKLSPKEIVDQVGKYVQTHCASQEKLEAAEAKVQEIEVMIGDLTQARNALAAIPSQKAEMEKYEAKIEAAKKTQSEVIERAATLDANKLQAIVGPATAAALKAVLPKKNVE